MKTIQDLEDINKPREKLYKRYLGKKQKPRILSSRDVWSVNPL